MAFDKKWLTTIPLPKTGRTTALDWNAALGQALQGLDRGGSLGTGSDALVSRSDRPGNSFLTPLLSLFLVHEPGNDAMHPVIVRSAKRFQPADSLWLIDEFRWYGFHHGAWM